MTWQTSHSQAPAAQQPQQRDSVVTVMPNHPAVGTSTFPTLTVELGFGAALDNEYLVFDDLVRGLFDTGKLAPEFVGVDISDDVRAVRTSRGRHRDLEAFVAGTCQILLDNRDGDYDPSNLSGQYVASGVSLVRR